MLRRPPRSTLFPCTRLFRSARRCVRRDRSVEVAVPELGVVPATREQLVVRSRLHDSTVVDDDEDRKSTRLNSSHQIISYAVFCLKKKKKRKEPKVRRNPHNI